MNEVETQLTETLAAMRERATALAAQQGGDIDNDRIAQVEQVVDDLAHFEQRLATVLRAGDA